MSVQLLQEVSKNLEGRGFNAYVCADAGEALAKVIEILPKGSSIAFPGSQTVEKNGMHVSLEEAGYRPVSHWYKVEGDRNEAILAEADADAVLMSANALTKSGMIFNTDGMGNRLMCTFNGPDKVVFIIGKNKIVDGGYEEAMDRVKNVASPQNCVRLNKKTPCAATGKCGDCKSPDRICSLTLVLEKRPGGPFCREYHVILVDEDMGY